MISFALVICAPVSLARVLLSGPINRAARASAGGGFLHVSVFSMFLRFFAWRKGMGWAPSPGPASFNCCSRS